LRWAPDRGGALRRAHLHIAPDGTSVAIDQPKSAPDALWIEHRLSAKRNAQPATVLGLREGGRGRNVQIDLETALGLARDVAGLGALPLAIWPYASALKLTLVAFKHADIYARVTPEIGSGLSDGAALRFPDGGDPIGPILFQAARRAAPELGQKLKRGHVALKHPQLRVDDAPVEDVTVVFEGKLRLDTLPTRLILAQATPQQELDALVARGAERAEAETNALDPVKPQLSLTGLPLPPNCAFAEIGVSLMAEAPLNSLRLAEPPRARKFTAATIHIVAREDEAAA
ncbi:MAG: hypothetical protein AAF684_07205, partial [Pseudomonadota bacterium]